MPQKSPEGEDGGTVKEENDDDAFAAVIERALQQASDEDEDEDESGSEDGEDGENDEDQEDGASDSESASGSASDDDEDDEEYSGAKKLVDDEIRQLESAIAKKNADIAKVTNAALKVRLMIISLVCCF
jgi:transcription initiation factor TFIID subunit 7